uniref:Microfibril associated protein 5 n=1 Tax=Sparus aurata TaxID=8175 RepID=A0A671W7Z1_SPAAU
LQVEGMGGLPVVLLLCSFHGTAAKQHTQIILFNYRKPRHLEEPCQPVSDSRLEMTFELEEMYPCTRMYSVHRPIKKCIGALCLYSLPRVYVINNEICMRTVCQQDEYLKESCPGGPDVLRGHLIGNAVAIAVATPKPGQTKPDGGPRMAM